jgi:hypothetical protein
MIGMDEVTKRRGISDISSAWYVGSIMGKEFKKPPILENLGKHNYISQKYHPKI